MSKVYKIHSDVKLLCSVNQFLFAPILFYNGLFNKKKKFLAANIYGMKMLKLWRNKIMTDNGLVQLGHSYKQIKVDIYIIICVNLYAVCVSDCILISIYRECLSDYIFMWIYRECVGDYILCEFTGSVCERLHFMWIYRDFVRDYIFCEFTGSVWVITFLCEFTGSVCVITFLCEFTGILCTCALMP